jgi:acyl-CoA thioesterase FadM
MYTARLDIRYRKNVPIGESLRIVGHVLKDKEHAATVKSIIFDQQGEMLAEADVLLVDIPADTYKDVDLDAVGWKVYPD